MRLLRTLLGERFWALAYAAIGVGLCLPLDAALAKAAIPFCLGALLFFTCLKVSPGQIAGELGRPRAARRVFALSALKLAGLPLIVFGLSFWLPADLALGLLLVSAMPAGMSSVAFADLHRGNVELALLVLLTTSLLSPLSVPLILELPRVVGLQAPAALTATDVMDRMLYVASLLGIPFAAAQLVRFAARAWVQRNTPRFTPVALLCLAVLILLATSATRARWFEGGGAAVAQVLLSVSLACAIFLGAGSLLGRVLPQGDAVGFTCNAVYVNNGLAVAYALAFYPERGAVVLPAILITVPMVWAIGFARRVVRSPSLE